MNIIKTELNLCSIQVGYLCKFPLHLRYISVNYVLKYSYDEVNSQDASFIGYL